MIELLVWLIPAAIAGVCVWGAMHKNENSND
jgi:hypothetical protein